ncbi:isopentenyl-diphosphate Delta-isomerase [Dyadobacter tibetensis]|uniref:isopentenyl-diphosphate Delta-isomerase n=1 Tax=Dyadobacter tibetensis TaxID=1211851 RepID=UPI000470E200|nr:isopentenyl-diphosphate Delta-isomerase [Dyadobacter tibetensis]
MRNEMVILVNEADEQTGLMEKLEAHEKGALHRAISVFIFNSKGEMLLQQRQHGKYHSEGLWTNTCCSHPHNGETTSEAAHRRLREEMGLETPLAFVFQFQYHAQLDQDLIEHEIDHVYIGVTDELPLPNPLEAAGYRYMSAESLLADLALHPEQYTEWFKICLPEVLKRTNSICNHHE